MKKNTGYIITTAVFVVFLFGLDNRHPDAAFVVEALHIAGRIDLQHGAAACPVLLPLLGIPLLPDLGVQRLQGAGQRALGGKHGPVAFREGHLYAPLLSIKNHSSRKALLFV